MKIVANAESIYADPSALLKLYLHQSESARVAAWRARIRGTLAVTHHGRVEIINGICLSAFYGHISADALNDAISSFEEDFDEGRYVQADLLWRAALNRAADLSRKHTAVLGCRSLDVLHVASALELGLKHFLTFDLRQLKLAQTAGLKPIRV